MATFGYLRVSSLKQVESGESLDAQRRKLEGQAMILGTTIDEFFVEEGISGGKPLFERPEGARLLARLEPGDVMLATKLDRTFRDAEDGLATLRRLKRMRCHLYLLDLGGDVTGSGISKLVFTLMAAMADWERTRIAKRLHEGLAHVRSQGRYAGGKLRYGYRLADSGAIEVDPIEQAALKRLLKLRRQSKSFDDIVAYLNSSPDRYPPRGKRWHATTVRRLCQLHT